MKLSLYEKIAGSLFAGALGDSIGAHFENQKVTSFFLPEDLRVTDDTQLTLATYEAIESASYVDPESIANQLVVWFRQRKITGIGSSTLKALIELEAGAHWALAGATGERSAGNGAAMRISPLAFFLDPDDNVQRQTIRDVCRITHRNDEAYLGALAVVFAIRRDQLDDDLIPFLISKLPDSRVRDRFIEIESDSPSVLQLAQKHLPSGYVVDSVPFAILAAVKSTDFMESIKTIVKCGGDTDTTASIFGNIYGAVNGSIALPMEIAKRIDAYPVLESTISGFARLTNSS